VGVGLKYIAEKYGLDFIPLKTEEYDFLINKKSLGKEPVKEFINILKSQWLRKILKETTGYKALENIGEMEISGKQLSSLYSARSTNVL
ncbi:MAG: hypothetical protein DRN04_13650, partial [Thermoprotei archaeon]